MLCDICGLIFNDRNSWGECPHPRHNNPNAQREMDQFRSRNMTKVPLMLGSDYQDPMSVVGSIELSGRGRSFFNTKNPYEMRLSIGCMAVGRAMIPVSFAIILPPIDPIFGDVRG